MRLTALLASLLLGVPSALQAQGLLAPHWHAIAAPPLGVQAYGHGFPWLYLPTVRWQGMTPLAGPDNMLSVSITQRLRTETQFLDDTIVSHLLFQARDAPESMSAFDPQLIVHTGLSRWRTPAGSAPCALLPEHPMGERGGWRAYSMPVQETSEVPDVGNTAPSALRRDWGGLGQDTVFFLGYQVAAIGLTAVLPQRVSNWDEKSISLQRWWEHVQHPTWDRDDWYINYIGHPYFGALYYIRARERGLGVFGSFAYAVLLSGLYEFGAEAFFEEPSYQDLLVTPVGGALLGALIFEPLRVRIKSKAKRQWYDYVALVLTDPLGEVNSMFARVLGIKTETRLHFRPPALAAPEPFNTRPARSLTRQVDNPHRSHGVSIEFILNLDKNARSSMARK